MDRTTISLDDELHEELRTMAAERGISVAALIREIAREKAQSHRRETLGEGGRTQSVLSPDLQWRLLSTADRLGIPVSVLIEETLDAHRPKPKSFGMGFSKEKDLARRSADMIFEPDSWRS